VVSVGWVRLFAGSVDGLGSASSAATLVGVTTDVFTRPASGSVPVFHRQRSTPHVAAMTADCMPTASKGKTNASARLSKPARGPLLMALRGAEAHRRLVLVRPPSCLRLPIVHIAVLN